MFACPPVERLDALLGEELPDQQRDSLEDHLTSCPRCQQTLIERSGDADQWNRIEPLLHTKPTATTTPTELLSGLRESCLALTKRIRPTQPESPPTIPGYEILGELGRGGMAVVYRARQVGLNRLVALKMILAGRHAAPELRDRFRREAEAVARLQHPNVVQVYDIGEHDGLPYFSMEFVEGGSLKEHLDGTPHAPHAAASLVETLARAMHATHLAGVVHRDLKPANILLAAKSETRNPKSENQNSPRLVSSFGFRVSDFAPKVTDFGLALHRDANDGWTRTGDILGTPKYMAPEQAQGRRSEVGPATDIHALGIILYELLTGRVPFVAEDDVTALVQVSFEEPVPPRRLKPSVPRDLETICLKCLRKLPRHRYGSALELAEDLRRFQAGEPIHARPISTRERVVKWARRRPFTAAMLVGMVLLAVGSFTGITWAMLDARAARNEESVQRKKAEDAGAKTLEALDQSERSVYFGNIAQARSQWLLNNVPAAAKLLDRCRVERRGWEWHYLRGLNHGDMLTIADTDAPWVTSLAFSPDGRWLASGGGDPYTHPNTGIVQVFDRVTGSVRWRKDGLPHLVRNLAFSPEGRFIATAGGNWREDGGGKLRLWDAATGDVVRDFSGHDDEPVYRVLFSPDGRLLASTSHQRATRVWNVATGKELYRTSKVVADSVAFTPNGRFLVLDGTAGIEFHDAADGKLVHTIPHVRGSFALSPDGTRLASLHRDQLRVWDITRLGTQAGEAELPLAQAFNGHEGNIVDLAFRPDGQAIATAGADGTVRLWELALESDPIIFRGHEGRVGSVAFHPDGRVLASGGKPPGDIKVWDATRKPECVTAVTFNRERSDVAAICFTADERELLALGLGGTLRRWDCSTGVIHESELRCSREWLFPAETATFANDGRLLAAVPFDDPNRVDIRETATGREVAVLRGHTVRVRFVACDRECQRVVTAATGTRENRTVREVNVWDVRTGRVIHGETASNETCDAVAISPDGTQLLEAHRVLETLPNGGTRTVTDSAVLSLRTLGSSASAQRLPVPGSSIAALTFSPKGNLIAAGSNTGSVRLWARDGNPLHEKPLPGLDKLGSLTFNPDETRLAGVNRDRVQVWDVVSGQDVLFLRGAGPRPNDSSFNPRVVWSGTKLAASNWDRSVSVWDTTDLTMNAGKAVLAAQCESRAFLWHMERSEAYRRPETAFAATFHRERLLAQKSLAPSQRRQRGDFLARLGRLHDAKAEYALLFAGELPDSPQTCREYALLLALAGDETAYKKLRTAALAKWADGRDPSALGSLVHLGSLLPASPEEAAQLLAAARRYHSLYPDRSLSFDVVGLAQYRAGEFEESKRSLLRSLEMNGDGEWVALPQVQLGAVLLRLGKADEANAWLKRADAWLTTQAKAFPPTVSVAAPEWDWYFALEVRLLRDQVESQHRKGKTP